MEMGDMVILGLLLLFIIILLILLDTNSKLKVENSKLRQILDVKDQTIQNFEASRVAVKDVIDNFSMHGEVMELIETGESQESIAQKLGIPVNKVELIIKFDAIRKEKQRGI
ncbi:MAG: sigma-70 family RNA polymerase sigma factor [Campylobacterales bacterium]|nr:sigma-70 family RNA polymerase sigma factor [Campylobacterales bacterium]